MPSANTLEGLLGDIADSIRTKKGTSDPIPAANFPTEIDSLSGEDFSDYSLLGTEVDVQAETTISKGSKIVGKLSSDYVAPTKSAGLHNISKLLVVSEDLSVAIADSNGAYIGQVVGEGYKFTFYFRNEATGLYDTIYVVTLENYPSNTKLFNMPVINDN